MGLRLKDGLHPDVLIQYGFKTGAEWAGAGERCMDDPGYEYMHGWYHKFAMNAEDPSRIRYTGEDYDEVAARVTFRPVQKGEEEHWLIDFECESDADMVIDIIYRLAKAGLLKGEAEDEKL